MIYGYARCSTEEQNLNAQLDALQAAGCTETLTDKLSGATTKRPGLDKLLALLRPGDTLVVTKIDRLGRSMLHLIETVTHLNERGIYFKSLSEGVDTTTPVGRMVLGIMASIAEFERERIRERIMDGMAAKKRRGERVGRPRALTRESLDSARDLLDAGHGYAHVARVLKVGRSTLYRSLATA